MYYIYTKDGIREVTEKEYYEKPTYFEFCRISNFHVSLFFIGILDPDYFAAGKARYEKHAAQGFLIQPSKTNKPETGILF